MAKQGMKRPDRTQPTPKNSTEPVPELQGKAKSGKDKARPFIAGTNRVYHTDRPISPAYPVLDTDLARDNVENDLTAADRQDL